VSGRRAVARQCCGESSRLAHQHGGPAQRGGGGVHVITNIRSLKRSYPKRVRTETGHECMLKERRHTVGSPAPRKLCIADILISSILFEHIHCQSNAILYINCMIALWFHSNENMHLSSRIYQFLLITFTLELWPCVNTGWVLNIHTFHRNTCTLLEVWRTSFTAPSIHYFQMQCGSKAHPLLSP
jgi:hypothetical protein